MKKIVFILSLLASIISLSAKNQKYVIDEIDAKLRKDAFAVVREYAVNLELLSPSTFIEEVTFAISIFNEDAIEKSISRLFYDKTTSISNIKVVVYNSKGDKVKSIPRDEIMDASAISGFSLFEDNRLKYINPKYRELPFTVVCSYTKKHKSTINYPSFYPIIDYWVSTERASFTVETKQENFRFYAKNTTIKPEVQNQKGKVIYKWQFQSLPAIRKEQFAPNVSDIVPAIYSAPIHFEYEDYAGNAATWQDFGKWIYDLNKSQNDFTYDDSLKVQQLYSGVSDTLEIIETLYQYMQQKTRYVSIQVGIGGFQPFKTSVVDENSYGDCKALSFYMKSLLEIAGINSYYTLVKAGVDETGIIDDFPSNQFNHAILAVPLALDTLWLECTNQYIPCGYLGSFTENRKVLLIDKNGGKLVKTISFNSTNNFRSSNTKVGLNNNAAASLTTITTNSGIFYDNNIKVMRMDEEDKEKFVLSNLYLNNASLKEFSFQEHRSSLPKLIENKTLHITDYGQMVNGKILVPIYPFNPKEKFNNSIFQRELDIEIKRSITEIDTIVIEVPDHYKIAFLPESQAVTSKFGDYSLEISQYDSKIVVVRRLIERGGRYNKLDYTKLEDFYDAILKSDKLKFILVKV